MSFEQILVSIGIFTILVVGWRLILSDRTRQANRSPEQRALEDDKIDRLMRDW